VSNSTYQNAGVVVSGGSADPHIQFVTVIGDGSTSGTYHGIKIGANADATVDYTDIQNSVYSHSIQVNNGGGICLCGPSFFGNNNIVRRTTDYKAINNPSTGQISAQYNWWGGVPNDTFFAYPALVTYSNWLGSPAGAGAEKRAVFVRDFTLFERGQVAESGKNYSEAIGLYKEAFRSEPDNRLKRRMVKALLRAMDKYDRNYADLRALIGNELPSATGGYEAFLKYIDDTILVREGRYREAMNAFAEDSEGYEGSVWEVQMLGRAAKLAGDYLNDTTAALEYASRAAEVNPGADVLRFAFEAAGERYNPAEFEDVFANDAPDNEPDHDTEKAAEKEAYVVVTLNPANPFTTIRYTLAKPGNVSLDIYSVSGQKVATLVDGAMTAGTHSALFDGSSLASGIYLYRFRTAGFAKSGKIALVK
jgi:tetratricopeptide (TPR) repeat protein